MSRFIAVCGGGGKTTLAKKYPHIFLDIDEFIWENHNNLLNNWDKLLPNEITFIYKKIMVKNKEKLKNINKIILGHHPINAEWLNIKCLETIKPIKNLHLENIKDRTDKHKKMSINDWNNLEDAYQYKSFLDLKNYLEYILLRKL